MVLLLCLIFLTALMLLGLSASADTILQTRLVANLVKSGQVNQSAQAALESGEQWLLNLAAPAADNCPPPCPNPVIHGSDSLPGNVQYQPLSWWRAHGQIVAAAPASSGAGQSSGSGNVNPPVWVIVSIHNATAPENPMLQHSWYRVVARASDSTGGLVTVLESIVLKTWPVSAATPATSEPPASTCSPETGGCGRVAWRRLR
jgi:Tfp pilus assembly protein PilX